METAQGLKNEPMETAFPTSRGAVLLLAAQFLALVAGFFVTLVLTRVLLPEAYGLYAVAGSVLAWMEILVLGGFGVALSKAVSEGVVVPTTAWRWVWRFYLPYCLLVWLSYNLVAIGFAFWLRDERLIRLLWVAGLALPFTGLWGAVRDLLMGVQAYGLQATVFATYALGRTVWIIGAALLTRSVAAVLFANALGAVTAFAVAMGLWCWWSQGRTFPESDQPIVSPFGLVLQTGLPVLLTTVFHQLAMGMDLWLVKRLIADAPAAGYYGAARLFAFVPFAIAAGISNALYPALCHELGKGRREKATALTKEAMRALLVALVPFCAVVWATAPSLTALLFSTQFLWAAEPLRFLTVAMSLFSVLAIYGTALVADNRAAVNWGIAVLACGLAYGLCHWLIPSQGIVGAAMAMVAVWTVGAGLTATATVRRLGWVIPTATLVRVSVASFGLYWLASRWHLGGLALIGEYLLLGTLYLGLLIALREFTRSDWVTLQTVIVGIWENLRRLV